MVRRGRRGMWKERNVQYDDRPENRGVTVCETCMYCLLHFTVLHFTVLAGQTDWSETDLSKTPQSR